MRKFFLAICAAILALSIMGCQKKADTCDVVAKSQYNAGYVNGMQETLHLIATQEQDDEVK